MKRLLAFIVGIMLLVIPFVSANAAGSAELGELLISSPEKMTGAVGDVVKVNFFLYPNLPDGYKLETIQGYMKYDPEFVTLGAINQTDEENNFSSLMKGKASMFVYNIEEPGSMRFAFTDGYGIDSEGFWFQAEFRIENEGATDFIFNGISYNGINVVDNDYQSAKSTSYYIEPVSVGGIYTEGQEVPADGAAEETYEPIEPSIETPAPVTPTPKPSNDGQTVPVTSTLPTYSANPAPSGIVTPAPAVTSMPITTPVPPEATAAPSGPNGQQGDISAEASAAPNGDPSDPANPGTDPVTGETIENVKPIDPNDSLKPNTNNQKGETNTLIVVGVIIGIVAVLGLGALAIVLILKRRKIEE